MLKAQAWFLRDGDDKQFTYRLQLDGCSIKSDKKIFSCLGKEWSKAGEIFYKDNENKIGYIFQRVFKTEKDFRKWAKSFPYPLVEISSISDRVKSAALGAKAHKGVGRPAGRRCGKCGELGHNARTCKGEKVAINKSIGKSKIPRKNRKKCSVCNQFDHNARTCPEKEKKS